MKYTKVFLAIGLTASLAHAATPSADLSTAVPSMPSTLTSLFGASDPAHEIKAAEEAYRKAQEDYKKAEEVALDLAAQREAALKDAQAALKQAKDNYTSPEGQEEGMDPNRQVWLNAAISSQEAVRKVAEEATKAREDLKEAEIRVEAALKRLEEARDKQAADKPNEEDRAMKELTDRKEALLKQLKELDEDED